MSAKSRYGLYVSVILSQNYSQAKLITSTELANTIHVGDKYLEQVLSLLKKDGIIVATRGAYGGYLLSKPPQDISVGRVLRACEDNLLIVDCIEGKCNGKHDCIPFKLFNKLYSHINAFLDNISLLQLLEEDK